MNSSSSDLSTSIITNLKDLENYRDEWRQILSSSGSNTVFLTLAWLTCCYKMLNAEGELFVVIVRKGGRVIGIAPLMIMSVNNLFIKRRRLQFIGGQYADYADFILNEDREACLAAIISRIYSEQGRWDYSELLHVTDRSPNWLILRKLLAEEKRSNMVEKFSVCPFVTLEQPMSGFYKSRPKSLGYDIKRGRQRLCEKGELSYEVLSRPEDAVAALPEFIGMLNRREEMAKRKGMEYVIKRMALFFQELIKNPDTWEMVHFSRLTLDGKAFAYHFGFIYGGRISWYKPTFDPEFSVYSPGKIIIAEALDEAIAAELSELDFLLGDEPYKFQWTDSVRDSHNFRLYNNRFKSGLCRFWIETAKPRLKKNALLLKSIRSIRRAGLNKI